MPHLRHTHHPNTLPKLPTATRQRQIPGETTPTPPHQPRIPTNLPTTQTTMDRRPLHPMLDLRRLRTTRRPVASRPSHTRSTRLNSSSRPPDLQLQTRSRTPMGPTTMTSTRGCAARGRGTQTTEIGAKPATPSQAIRTVRKPPNS